MPRFFAPPASWETRLVRLDSDESRHAAEVLRIQPGQHLTVFDGVGRSAVGVLRKASKQGAEIEIESCIESPRVPCEVVLIQAVPKGKLMEWILEKSTELGVSRIVPVITERSVVQIDSGDVLRKQEKWQRVVVEACKQCGQNWMPLVERPVSLTAFLGANQCGDFSMFGSLHPGSMGLGEALESASSPRDASVFIGPEGDFSASEAAALTAWGALPVSLGSMVLRVETAALYCLSVLGHTFLHGSSKRG